MLEGWGRYPKIAGRTICPATPHAVRAAIGQHTSLIARGNGRAYGDAALNPCCTLDMRRQDRLIDFDPESGLLVCEAGLLLTDLIDIYLPRGWFVPVTPGTRFVTIGGMVAADVHGKNHHVHGSFGQHVLWLDLALADGSIRRCSQDENADLFHATIGGMGLTGIILAVAFHLRPVETDLVHQTLLKAGDLDEVMDLFEAHAGATYSVAWIDCLATGRNLGRSLLMTGEHLRAEDLPASRGKRAFGDRKRSRLSVPMDLPGFALNRFSVSAFNALYHARGRAGESIVGLEPYFYPLDAIGNWPRIYGRSGFLQYQFVLPLESSRQGMRTILNRIAASGHGSFLAVLKLFGAAPIRPGSLSFPLEGYTLALDFPASVASFNLFLELDAMVLDFGGRLYLAKDARAGSAMMRHYPELETFRLVRGRFDPTRHFSSLQSQRLGL